MNTAPPGMPPARAGNKGDPYRTL